jgi:hypothetical protein
MDNPLNLSAEITSLLQLISRPSGVSREQFLKLACKLSGSEPCAATLWLFDDASDRGYFLLDRCYSSQDTGPPPPGLRRKWAKREASEAHPRAEPAITLARHPEIDRWCRQQGFAPYEQQFPLHKAADRALLGYLQLLSANPIPANNIQLMSFLSDSLASAVLRSRDERRLATLDIMRSGIDLRKPLNDWLQQAAKTLQDKTAADACIVFRPERDLSLRAVAASPVELPLNQFVASPESLIRQIAQSRRVVRLADFQDRSERLTTFGTDHHDQQLLARIRPHLGRKELFSAMAAPVVVGGHATAVILVLNKNKYLAEQFSQTDQMMLEAVCNLLSGIAPSVLTYNAMVDISGTVFKGKLEDKTFCQSLFELLSKHINGLACVTLYLRSPHSASTEIIHFGGPAWFDSANAPLQPTAAVMP